jgi:hypothetical protein
MILKRILTFSVIVNHGSSQRGYYDKADDNKEVMGKERRSKD